MMTILIQNFLIQIYVVVLPVQAPVDLLVDALEKHPKTQVSAIERMVVAQPTGMMEMRLSWEQNSDGAVRKVVVSPLRLKGLVVVDDGYARTTYNPYTNSCDVQPSPGQFAKALPAARRATLVRSNYNVTYLRSEKIGSREAKVLVAKPKQKGAFERYYWIDTANHVILRMQVNGSDGRKLYVDEMLFPNFEKKIPADSFSTKFGCAVEVRSHAKQAVSYTLSDLRKKVGFDIIAPAKLPFGMTFIYAEAKTNGDRQAAALRYSDGLANASVYQSPGMMSTLRVTNSTGADRTMVFSNRGTKYTIIADLGEEGMKEFVRSFESASKVRREQWATNVAKAMGVEKVVATRILDRGMDFDQTAFLMAVMKESRKSIEELARWRFMGLTDHQIVEKSQVDWNRVQQLMRLAKSSNY